MAVLYIVLPLALMVSALAVATFLWAVRRGQFDDLESPAHRILHDDESSPPALRAGTRASPTTPVLRDRG